MQEVKLNYHNGALRSKCFELCIELCTVLVDRLTGFLGSLCPLWWKTIFSHGGGGAGCSVGCGQLSSSVFKQSLCSMSAIQQCVCHGTEGVKVGKGGSCLNSHLCYYLKTCLTKWWWLPRSYHPLLNRSPLAAGGGAKKGRVMYLPNSSR